MLRYDKNMICDCIVLKSRLSKVILAVSFSLLFLLIFIFSFTDIVRVPQNDGSLSTSRALFLVAIIFGSSLIALGLLYKQFPDLEE